MISVKGLRKTFGARVAIDDLSLGAQAGETLGLLGPNGAGKSTTIHVITGVLPADAGTVSICGGNGPEDPAARRRLGVAPQSIALYPDLTAAENLAFFGRLYGIGPSVLRERVTACLDLAGLSDRRDDRVSTFSGGMQRRLNLACALVHEPDVILLDEPTAGVDPQSRNHLFESVERLKAEGRTILYTTHYMEEAERLCDRVAIIDAGRILAMDTVDALIARHGGPSTLEAELVRLPDDVSSLPGTLDGNVLRVTCERPLEEAARLASGGIAYRTLNIRRADLESVFLSLTGRTLRD